MCTFDVSKTVKPVYTGLFKTNFSMAHSTTTRSFLIIEWFLNDGLATNFLASCLSVTIRTFVLFLKFSTDLP